VCPTGLKKIIMATSSINIQPVKGGSEMHNNREKKLDYVKEDLTPTNEQFFNKSISAARQEIAELYQKKVGQKLQEKATPIREAVLIVEQHHKIEDLQNLALKIESRFKVTAIQGYIHRDEGHLDGQEWKPNLHAHLVFDWQNKETGKSVKLNRQDMAELQTMVANHLGMERGVSSDKKHLSAIQFKAQEEEKKLNKVLEASENLETSHRSVDEYFVKGLFGISKDKTIEGLKTALKEQITNNQRLENKNDDLNRNIKQVKKEKQQDIDRLTFGYEFTLKAAYNYLKNPTLQNEKSLKSLIKSHTEDKELSENLKWELRQEKYQDKSLRIEKNRGQSNDFGIPM
jgi:hypothetical protein